MAIHEGERTRNENEEEAIQRFRENVASLGIGLPNVSGTQPPVTSPAIGGFYDWLDFPEVVAAYAHSFPKNGPMDRRSQDWEDQIYPSRNPNTKRPRGPGESVIMS
jgi:hypothetical protein